MKLCLLGHCCLVRLSFDFRFLGGLFFSGVCDNFRNIFCHDKLVDWVLHISVTVIILLLYLYFVKHTDRKRKPSCLSAYGFTEFVV